MNLDNFNITKVENEDVFVLSKCIGDNDIILVLVDANKLMPISNLYSSMRDKYIEVNDFNDIENIVEEDRKKYVKK